VRTCYWWKKYSWVITDYSYVCYEDEY